MSRILNADRKWVERAEILRMVNRSVGSVSISGIAGVCTLAKSEGLRLTIVSNRNKDSKVGRSRSRTTVSLVASPAFDANFLTSFY